MQTILRQFIFLIFTELNWFTYISETSHKNSNKEVVWPVKAQIRLTMILYTPNVWATIFKKGNNFGVFPVYSL